ncbi:hypothetical protein PP939_gp232 [Rhizobium phage RL38J1]|uniref:Uncharacterized protein n=1 Tax=Rhizobium phage RL38J1 TaxID=2663232 RepID=A0A6B9J1K8_9CAUD|nr:hypothetical protein PP939_gp232 [Rhizobium phage RL38J1]QGZ14067.1 hypothetical protein RL38J1_232 [Rhizobium phage RL38J1]
MAQTVELIFGSINENMECALQQEEIMIACGPGDPYYRIAKANVEYYLKCAAALERGETHLEVKHADRFK